MLNSSCENSWGAGRCQGIQRLDEVAARIELVFGVVDQSDDGVAIVAGVLLLAQIDLTAVVDGGALLVGDHLDERSFGIGLVHGRLENNSQLVSLKHDETADRDDADADDDDRQRGRLHRHGEALDDVGRVTGRLPLWRAA